MPLKLVKRKGSRVWYMRGTVAGGRVFETTGTESRALAEQKKAKRETDIYEDRALGRGPSVPFISAAAAYIEFQDRGEFTENAVDRLVAHFDRKPVRAIKQAEADGAVYAILRPDAAPATKVRIVYTPLTSILTFSSRRGWCDEPHFEKPRMPKGKTNWLAPAQGLALIAAAALHLKALILFILCTGARLAEALELQWHDVDLTAGTAILRDTKNGHDRTAALTPMAIVALANLPFTDPAKGTRDGAVFLTDEGRPYADRERLMGGQIKTAWRTACIRAGLAITVLDENGEIVSQTPTITPHDLRHTWATWFYALTKDLLLLKDEGGWRTLAMVERYAHLMPKDLTGDIHTVWGASHPRIGALPVNKRPADRKEGVG